MKIRAFVLLSWIILSLYNLCLWPYHAPLILQDFQKSLSQLEWHEDTWRIFWCQFGCKSLIPFYKLLWLQNSFSSTCRIKHCYTPQLQMLCENSSTVKGSCSDRRPHPPFFSNIMEILIPKGESYLEGFMCEVSCTNSLTSRVMSENPFWN